MTDPKYSDWDQAAREFGMTGVDEMVAAAARQPAGTLMLRSDRLTPAELADEVLARADLRQVHRDSSGCGRQDRWTQKKPRPRRTSSGADLRFHLSRLLVGSCVSFTL